MLTIDPNYEPPVQETRSVFGINLTQERNDASITSKTFDNVLTLKDQGGLPASAVRDLTVATIALKYTQSNSVCYALNGQVIGLGAGQQSRIACVSDARAVYRQLTDIYVRHDWQATRRTTGGCASTNDHSTSNSRRSSAQRRLTPSMHFVAAKYQIRASSATISTRISRKCRNCSRQKSANSG